MASQSALSSSVPARCEACDTAIPHGRDRCPGCGKLYGEWNRCPSCHARAALHEVAPRSFVCAACGAPRPRTPGTTIDTAFADELYRRSWLLRIASLLLWPTGAGLVSLSVLTFGMTHLIAQWLDGASSVGSVFAGLFAAAGAATLWIARRIGKRARALAAHARSERLLAHVTRARAGVTAAQAASALRLAPVEADLALTDLAKRGQLDLDVDDHGVVRYRVLTDAQRLRRELVSDADAEPDSAAVQRARE